MQQTICLAKISSTPQRIERRGRDKKRSISECPGRHVTDALGKWSFQPVIGEDADILDDWEDKEGEFFRSLSYLAHLYQFEPVRRRDYAYPLNIYRAFQHANEILYRIDPAIDLCIVRSAKRKASLATFITFTPKFDLYYIPLVNYHAHVQAAKQPDSIGLLNSVMAYVHKILQIDFFTEENSFLHYYYTMLADSLLYEQSDENELITNGAVDTMKCGRDLEYELLKPNHIKEFQRRLKNYKRKGRCADQLRALAASAFDLYRAYPDRSIVDSFRPDIQYPKPEYEEAETVQGYETLSFIWDTDDPTGKQVLNYVDDDLNNKTEFDRPLSVQVFDTRQSSVTLSLDFERRVYELLAKLSSFLNKTTWKT